MKLNICKGMQVCFRTSRESHLFLLFFINAVKNCYAAAEAEQHTWWSLIHLVLLLIVPPS